MAHRKLLFYFSRYLTFPNPFLPIYLADDIRYLEPAMALLRCPLFLIVFFQSERFWCHGSSGMFPQLKVACIVHLFRPNWCWLDLCATASSTRLIYIIFQYMPNNTTNLQADRSFHHTIKAVRFGTSRSNSVAVSQRIGMKSQKQTSYS